MISSARFTRDSAVVLVAAINSIHRGIQKADDSIVQSNDEIYGRGSIQRMILITPHLNKLLSRLCSGYSQ